MHACCVCTFKCLFRRGRIKTLIYSLICVSETADDLVASSLRVHPVDDSAIYFLPRDTKNWLSDLLICAKLFISWSVDAGGSNDATQLTSKPL
jgi:hypothetical protein